MADTDEQIPGLLVAADHLERWTEGLPRWSDDGRETWYGFLNRRYEAEVAVIQRLRRARNCRIGTCPMRREVDLTLGGLSVRTDQGLEAALREWARRARGRLGR